MRQRLPRKRTRNNRRQGAAHQSGRVHRSRCVRGRMSGDRDNAGVRERAARRRYPAGESELRDQRPGHLHRRRAGRHGPHPQSGRTGKAGHRNDRRKEGDGAARCRHHRRRSRRHCVGPRRHPSKAALSADRAGTRSWRRDPSLSAQQDRDDLAGRAADRRPIADRRDQQGAVAADLAGRRRPIRLEDRFRYAHGAIDANRRRLSGRDDEGDVRDREYPSRDRTAGNAAQARCARRRSVESRVSADRARTISGPPGSGRRRRRQRRRVRARVQHAARNDRGARVPWRGVQPDQARQPAAARGSRCFRTNRHSPQDRSEERRRGRGRARRRGRLRAGRQRRRHRPGRRRAADRAAARPRRDDRDQIRHGLGSIPRPYRPLASSFKAPVLFGLRRTGFPTRGRSSREQGGPGSKDALSCGKVAHNMPLE